MERTFRTNIFGYFYMARRGLAHLKEGSAIINTGSITGMEGSKELLDYSSTKGAIHAFTKSLAQNLVERGIRVNCVAPGPVWTPLNPADQDAEKVAKFGERRADEAAGPAGGDRARLRLLRRAGLTPATSPARCFRSWAARRSAERGQRNPTMRSYWAPSPGGITLTT